MSNPFNMLAEIIEGSVLWAGSFLNYDFASYGHLETTAGNASTIVTSSGSLLTLIEISGSMEVTGPQETAGRCESLARAFHSYMQQPGHAIDFYAAFGSSSAKDMLYQALRPYRETAARLNLDFDDLFEAKVNALAPYTTHETVLFALYTAPNMLTKEAIALDRKTSIQRAVDAKMNAGFSLGQNPSIFIESLYHKHVGFVRAVAEDLRATGLQADVLPATDAANRIRSQLFPGSTPREWRPSLVQDGPRNVVSAYGRQDRDASFVVPPKLKYQMIADHVHDMGDGVVRAGRRYFKTITLEMAPHEVGYFEALTKRIGRDIPWSIHAKMAGGGRESNKVKRMVASVFGFISHTNGAIKKGFDALDALEDAGDCTILYRAAFTTWGNSKDEVLRNVSTLSKAVIGWGTCQVDEVVTQPYLAFASSVLGFSDRHIGAALVAPLFDMAKTLPVSRPASPWRSGAVLLRTPEGKIYPYQPGSSVQDSWVTLIYSPMGGGKSVVMNAINQACVLAAGNTDLPYVTIIDVGPSSSGLISLLQDALPEGRKHLAAYHKLTMSESNAINPFDTQLGYRYPSQIERGSLVNFLSLIGTPAGQTAAYDGVTDIAGLLVDEAYTFFADGANPKRYERNIDQEVDAKLDDYNFTADNDSTWWEVVDFLFSKGEIHAAWSAQRYAVPVLSDLTTILNSRAIRDVYDREGSPFKVAQTGEKIVEALGRMISTAIREYPVLAGHSRFSMGDARVVSLDLNEVARGVGEAGQRQAAIMFMLARAVSTKNFYLMPEMLDSCPSAYKSYHEQRIRDARETLKVLAIDELHRTGGLKGFRTSVLQDIREGRKWNLKIMLASQFLEDFDEPMVDGASVILVLRSPNSKASRRVQELLGLSDSARIRLEQEVHGPGPGGANMLAWFRTKKGNFSQIVTNTLGAVEKWAFSTTTEDVAVRTILYKRFGGKKSRAALAELFPDGTAKPAIEQYKEQMGIRDDSNGSAIDKVIKDVSDFIVMPRIGPAARRS